MTALQSFICSQRWFRCVSDRGRDVTYVRTSVDADGGEDTWDRHSLSPSTPPVCGLRWWTRDTSPSGEARPRDPLRYTPEYDKEPTFTRVEGGRCVGWVGGGAYFIIFAGQRVSFTATNLKQNEAQSARAESTHEGVT